MTPRPFPAVNFTNANLAALAPTTEAFLFLQTVTGIAAVDLVRDNRGEVVGVVARGKRGLNIGLKFHEGDAHG